MKKSKGNALTDALVIVLLILATLSSISQTVRVQSRRSQQSQIRLVRRQENIQ